MKNAAIYAGLSVILIIAMILLRGQQMIFGGVVIAVSLIAMFSPRITMYKEFLVTLDDESLLVRNQAERVNKNEAKIAVQLTDITVAKKIAAFFFGYKMTAYHCRIVLYLISSAIVTFSLGMQVVLSTANYFQDEKLKAVVVTVAVLLLTQIPRVVNNFRLSKEEPKMLVDTIVVAVFFAVAIGVISILPLNTRLYLAQIWLWVTIAGVFIARIIDVVNITSDTNTPSIIAYIPVVGTLAIINALKALNSESDKYALF